MSRKIILALIIVLLIALAGALYLLFGSRPSMEPVSQISLPDGFRIDVYAGDLSGPRLMLFQDNVLFVTVPGEGRVVALPDRNGDKKADTEVTFIDGLNNPHGIDFYNGWFYIAEENRVIRIKAGGDNLTADRGSLEILIDNLPTGGHFTRTIKIRNDSIYLSIGSSCNVCYEQDERRAAILKCNLDGTDCRTYAKGLRNAVGFVFHPLTGKMYATENGRDWLGEDLPPDEINLVEEGKNYGWPICYGKNIHDTDFDKRVYVRNPCMEPFEIPSLVDLQAHSAPLGLAFYYGDRFPEEYRGNLFVAFHGSWNRNVPTGYKIVRIDMDNFTVKDFATGWLNGSSVKGRPVDVIVAGDGSLFVSDDSAGKIYRIY